MELVINRYSYCKKLKKRTLKTSNKFCINISTDTMSCSLNQFLIITIRDHWAIRNCVKAGKCGIPQNLCINMQIFPKIYFCFQHHSLWLSSSKAIRQTYGFMSPGCCVTMKCTVKSDPLPVI